MDIFKFTKRPDPSLFYRGHDPNDIRLGYYIKSIPEEFQQSKFVILGCPQDQGVIRNNGRPGGYKAPDAIRQALYRFVPPRNIETLAIFDLGNLLVDGNLEEIHSRLQSVIETVLQAGKRMIILGGGNDISYPDCSALANNTNDLLVFNIDKHFDVRDLRPCNSGTPYRMLLEEERINPKKFYELGEETFANPEVYRKYLLDKGAHVYSLDFLRTNGLETVVNSILRENTFDSIFWGLDIDSVRASDAPGVSASYPTGFTAEEMIILAKLAGGEQLTKIIEFTEVNPEFDVDGRTVKLVATLIYYFLNNLT